MIVVEDTFKGGIPALVVMVGAVAVLAFLRLVVPRLIRRFQTKKPISPRHIKK